MVVAFVVVLALASVRVGACAVGQKETSFGVVACAVILALVSVGVGAGAG